jgi:hypothetical protein
VKEKLRWMGNRVDFILVGVYDVGSKGPRIKRLISISGQDDWENYMSVVMDRCGIMHASVFYMCYMCYFTSSLCVMRHLLLHSFHIL